MKIYHVVSLLLLQLFFGCNDSLEFKTSSPVPDQKQKTDKAVASTIVFRSADGGQTWENISEGLPEPVKDDYSCGRNVSFANDSGLYLTVGKWLYNNKPNSTASLWTKQLIPDEHSSIITGKSRIFAYHSDGHFFEKISGTNKWLPIYTNFQQKRVLTIFESVTGSIFIGTDGGLFKSTDHGKTWKGVHTSGSAMKVVESNGVLMAININGIIRSTDDGENWDWVIKEDRRGFLVENIKSGFAVSFDKTRSENRIVQTSYDDGKTWQSIEGDLPASYSITSIIQVGENFFCGHPTGIYRTSDKGKTWKLLLPSIKDKVFNLCVSGKVIYAIARNRGC